MDEVLREQSLRLYEVYADLARAFQLRDRERVSCHGISVSGCHALETLTMRGPLTMSELAGSLHLENSTVTRLVDRLVAAGLAVRISDPQDGRISRVHQTDAGRKLMERIRQSLVAEQARVLEAIPSGSREAVITAIGLLLTSFRRRQSNGATVVAGRAQAAQGHPRQSRRLSGRRSRQAGSCAPPASTRRQR